MWSAGKLGPSHAGRQHSPASVPLAAGQWWGVTCAGANASSSTDDVGHGVSFPEPALGIKIWDALSSQGRSLDKFYLKGDELGSVKHRITSREGILVTERAFYIHICPLCGQVQVHWPGSVASDLS